VPEHAGNLGEHELEVRVSLEDAEDHELVDGPYAPLARVEQPEVERGLAHRIAVLRLRRHRADVRRQGHVETGTDGEEAIEIRVPGLRHARLPRGGAVDAADAGAPPPLELVDARVDVPERELREPEATAAGDGTEVGEP